MHAGLDLPCLSELGKVTVRELDWSQPEHFAAACPPYDFILAADCVYHEELVKNFFETVLAMVTLKSTGTLLQPAATSLHQVVHMQCQPSCMQR